MELLKKIGPRRLYKITRSDLPSHTYIIANPSSRKIHFDPTITDFELYKLSTECNETFLKFAGSLGLFKNCRTRDVCELILLSGGFYYHLNQAFYNVFGYSLPAAFIGVRRILGKNPRGIISYDNLEAVPNNNVTLIGDTIATGATLIDSINYYLQKTREQKLKVKKLVIFTIAGALPGLRQLARLETKIQKEYGTELRVFFSDAIFGLAQNQTDMHYFHPDTILPDESRRAALKGLGEFLGKRLCVIWDWGQRNKNPIGHLTEVVNKCRKLGPSAAQIVKKAERILKKRENAL